VVLALPRFHCATDRRQLDPAGPTETERRFDASAVRATADATTQAESSVSAGAHSTAEALTLRSRQMLSPARTLGSPGRSQRSSWD
jgi:hypothetical protein